MAYSINALKMMESPDGVVFNCNILKDGKKVGSIHQGGFGGDNEYYFPNQKDLQDFDAAAQVYKATLSGDDAKYFSLDTFAETLIQAFEAVKENARITKWAKKFVAECRAKNYKGDFLLYRRNGAVCSIAPIRIAGAEAPQAAQGLAKNKATSWEKYDGVSDIVAVVKVAAVEAK